MDKTAEECISLIESDRGDKLSLHNLDVIALKFRELEKFNVGLADENIQLKQKNYYLTSKK